MARKTDILHYVLQKASANELSAVVLTQFTCRESLGGRPPYVTVSRCVLDACKTLGSGFNYNYLLSLRTYVPIGGRGAPCCLDRLT